jgi:signal peptidase II
MSQSSLLRRRRVASWVLFAGLTAAITAADLWSKRAVFEFLGVRFAPGKPAQILRNPPPREFPVIDSWFHLEANLNFGAFNGWFAEHTGALAGLSLAALVVITGIVWYALRKPPFPGYWFVAALGLIAGGTAGNLYDRYFLEAVRDWIKWFFVDAAGEEHVWPNFNLADSGICVGVSILVVLEVVKAARERRAKRPAFAETASVSSAR